MNIALDELLRRLCENSEFHRRAGREPATVAAEAGVAPSSLSAALDGNVLGLYERGAHPLLIMAIAETTGVDPMAGFAAGGEDAPTG